MSENLGTEEKKPDVVTFDKTVAETITVDDQN
jgi:hypothetical protein